MVLSVSAISAAAGRHVHAPRTWSCLGSFTSLIRGLIFYERAGQAPVPMNLGGRSVRGRGVDVGVGMLLYRNGVDVMPGNNIKLLSCERHAEPHRFSRQIEGERTHTRACNKGRCNTSRHGVGVGRRTCQTG